nr:tetratricopeptide repeat protein [Candidatus Odyssella thessalonicensis]
MYERKKDYSHAYYYYHLAANQKYAAAQNSLGWIQEKGLNGSKDEVAAFNNYRSAAQQGHTFAILNFAYCLEHGIGTQADKVQAQAWYATVDNVTLAKWRTARGLN